MNTTVVESINIKAYKLLPDCENVNPDLGSHAQVVPFDGVEQVSPAMSSTSEQVEFPVPVEFQGLLSTIRQTDFPAAEDGWPLMSKRMLAVLESVGPFPHRVLPARIIEGRIGRSLAEDPRYDEQGKLKPDFYTDDYVLLQLTEHLDAVDLDRSIYDIYHTDVKMISGLSKPIFRDIGQEYPPIFRCTQSPVDIFITEKAKRALEFAGILDICLFNYDTGYLLLTNTGYIPL
jgi:hypothetical protein